jgi:hypothetical protein
LPGFEIQALAHFEDRFYAIILLEQQISQYQKNQMLILMRPDSNALSFYIWVQNNFGPVKFVLDGFKQIHYFKVIFGLHKIVTSQV